MDTNNYLKSSLSSAKNKGKRASKDKSGDLNPSININKIDIKTERLSTSEESDVNGSMDTSASMNPNLSINSNASVTSKASKSARLNADKFSNAAKSTLKSTNVHARRFAGSAGKTIRRIATINRPEMDADSSRKEKIMSLVKANYLPLGALAGALIFLIVVLVVVSSFGHGRKVSELGFNDIRIEVYKSRNSRDEEKTMQREFNAEDPIQVKIIFKTRDNNEDNSMLRFSIYNPAEENGNREGGLYGGPVIVPFMGEGERFLTVPSEAGAGNYTVEVWSEDGYTLIKEDFVIEE